jgi:hypothetical protein
MPLNYTKSLSLMFDDIDVTCQGTGIEMVDEPEGGETATTYCGTEEIPGTPKWTINVSAFQDWGSDADSVFERVHAAYIASPPEELPYVMTVGSRTRTGTCRVLHDPPFGADAGSAFAGDMSFAVIGTPVEGTVTAGP